MSVIGVEQRLGAMLIDALGLPQTPDEVVAWAATRQRCLAFLTETGDEPQVWATVEIMALNFFSGYLAGRGYERQSAAGSERGGASRPPRQPPVQGDGSY